jgi:hypothetical protein
MRLLSLEKKPDYIKIVVVSVKENPSIPLTLIAIGCFGSGMLLVIFRTAYKMVRV